MRLRRAFVLAIRLLAAGTANAQARGATAERPAFLFSYFTRNGEDGVHLAYSNDGTTWSPLNGGRSVIRPAVTGDGIGWQEWTTKAALMRDPCILQGPDGMFHMVWTIAWTDHGIGVAHSRDLIHWSAQTRVPVMEHEPTALNSWAPELFYDDAKQEWMIFWATSIPGRFPASDSIAQNTSRGRADHRLYYVTTKDFKTYSKTGLLYDGGFAAIDGTIKKKGDTYYLVMKDETFFPKPVRSLRVATSKNATGPYGPASPPFTAMDTEGPSILHSGDWWYVYFDEYTRGHYGAVRTKDFEHFELVSDSLKTPRGIRHGSAFLAPQSVLSGLLALDSAQRNAFSRPPRPIIRLGGFQRIHLEPGEEREVTFNVGPEQLRMLDAKMKWVVEPGTFRILVGSSSRDLRLRGDLIVQ
jgi:hypothetical protein